MSLKKNLEINKKNLLLKKSSIAKPPHLTYVFMYFLSHVGLLALGGYYIFQNIHTYPFATTMHFLIICG
jgi:uncharacterized membrane protein